MQMTSLLTGASLGAVFESSGEALLVLNAQGIVQQANPRACELLRIPAERAPVKTWVNSFLHNLRATLRFPVSCTAGKRSRLR